MSFKEDALKFKSRLKNIFGRGYGETSSTSTPNLNPGQATTLATGQISSNTSPAPANISVTSGPDVPSWAKSEGWPSLRGCLDTIGQAVNAAGFGPLKTVIEGLVGCIEIYENAAQDRQAYAELRSELDDIFRELQQYITLSPTAVANISDVCGSIRKEIDYVKSLQVKPRVRRLAEAKRDEDNVLACYTRMRRHLQALSRKMGVSTLAIVEQHAMDDHLEKLAPALSACYDSGTSVTLKRGPCTEGTRVKVLDQMYEWATNADSGNVYWISGMAGTGKTTIAYSLCKRLEMEPDCMLGASFFCSRSLPECRSVGKIIPSIAYQLAHLCQPFRHALCEKIRTIPTILDGSPNLQFESLIVAPLSNLRVQQALPVSTLVVIDALDECEDVTSTYRILEVISTKSKGLPIKFVLSSRPEPAIRDHMGKDSTWIDARVVLHELDSGEVQTDIRTYLKAELAVINPSESQVKQLVERAGVLFIYAATVIRYVGHDNFRRNPRARLQTVLDTSRKQGRAQTKEIDHLYQTILEVAMNEDELEETEQGDMRLILHTIICAKTPLTASSLNVLLELGEVERVYAALRPLWSVLHVMEPEMMITVLHTSFPDYLTDSTRSGDSKWYCDAAFHNHVLAQRCFEYIRDTKPQFNICQLESSHLDDDEVQDLNVRVQNLISIELRYACLYWSGHLVAFESCVTPTLITLLEQFLSRHLLLWMEVMNLTKNIAASPGNLTTAKQWAIKHAGTQELIDLIHDAVRFALTIISSPISHSTPHIYVSMLPLLPSRSPVRKHYAHRVQGIIDVNGPALELKQALLARWSLGICGYTTCSPDGSLLFITTDVMKSCRSLIDTSNGKLVREFSHKDVGRISCVAFSPDGTRIASGTSHKEVWVWDVNSGEPILGPLEGHQDSVTSIIFSRDGSHIISGSSDKTIRTWDAYSGKSIFTPLLGHTGNIISMAVSLNGAKIISGSSDKTVRVWDIQTGRSVLDPIIGHTSTVSSVALSPDDKFIVSGSEDSTVCVWDAQTGRALLGLFLQNSTSPVHSVAISPDGARISAGFNNGTIQTWDAINGKVLSQPLEDNQHPVTMLAYSLDDTRIISYSGALLSRGMICIFDAQAETIAPDALPGHTESITSIDISPDEKWIVSGSEDRSVCVWDLIKGQIMLGPLTGHTDGVRLVRYSPDGHRILSCSKDRALRQWDAQTGDCFQTKSPIIDTSQPVTIFDPSNAFDLEADDQFAIEGFSAATYSPDGSYIATVSCGASVCVWNSRTGKKIIGPMNGETEGKMIAFSPDGTALVTVWGNGALQLWDIQSGECIANAPSQLESLVSVSAFAFSSDWLRSAVAIWYDFDEYSALYVNNREGSGEPTTKSFEGHAMLAYITSVRFSPDGERIASGSYDKTVHIWDAETGISISGPLEGHTDRVRDVAYSPYGAYVASASDDKTIRVWDADIPPGSSPLAEWVLDKDGWVRDRQSQRLIWVPPNLWECLLLPGNTMRLSRDGYVRLNYEGAMFGKSWANCWIDG